MSNLGTVHPKCDGAERIAVAFLLRGSGKSVFEYKNTRCPDFKAMGNKSDRPCLMRPSLALDCLSTAIIEAVWRKEIVQKHNESLQRKDI